MTNTINVTGTGGIIEGNLGAANVNVNLDDVLNFDGVDDKIDTNITFSTTFDGACTISAWLKPTDGQGTGMNFFGTRNSASEDWVQGKVESGGQISLYYESNNNGTEAATSASIFPDGVTSWTHVAFTIPTSGTIGIYVNGVAQTLDGTKNGDMTGITVGDFSSTVDLFIGCRSTNGTPEGFYKGYIADFRLQDSVLTAAEIGVLASKINVAYELVNSTQPTGWYKLTNNNTSNSGSGGGTPTVTGTTRVYDAFSVDVYDNSTTTDGTFTVTQGKVEGLALSSVDLNGSDDFININNSLESWTESAQKTFAAWVYNDGNASTARIFNTGFEDSGSKTAFGLGLTLSTVNKPYAFLRDTSAGAIQQEFGEIHSNNTWMHYAIVQDGANDQAFLYQNGVLQATISSVGEINQTTTVSAKMGVHWLPAQSQYFNGKIKDVRLYDYDFSDEQVASLYSGTYPQTPLHHWKLDEGYTSGTAANTAGAFEDSGTGTDLDAQGAGLVNASCVNGTLDLDHDLVIAANGTLSAPRGNIQFSGTSWDDNSTNGFIGNSGTLAFDHTTSQDFYGNSGTGYSNIKSDGGGSNIRWRETATCTGITIDSGGSLTPKGDNFTINCTGNIVNNGTWKFSDNSTNGITVAGASATSPAVCSGNEWNFNSESTASICLLKDLDFQFNITTGNATGAGAITLRLTGDCEFDAVTVSSGDTLDLSGQRMFTSGLVTISGDNGLKNTTDGSTQDTVAHLITNGIIASTTTHHASLSNVVYIADGGSNQHKIEYFDFGTFVSTRDGNIDFGRYGPDSSSINVIAANGGNLSNWGRTGSVSNANSMNNFTIATGTTAVPESATLTVAGDFTTSGGLIGKSALNANDTHAAYGTATSYNSADILSITMSGWFKLNSDFASQETNQAIYRQNDNFLIVQADGSAYCGFELSNAANNSYSYPAVITANGTITADNKWHHMAATWKETEGIKLYLDGKLIGELNDATTGGDFVKLRRRDGTTATVGGRNGTPIVQQFAGTIGQFARWQHTDTSAAKSAAQIRTEMFQKASELSSTTGLYLWFQFDEGTGTTAEDLSPNGTDFTVGTLAKSAEASWAGSGTFTRGTSTVNMTGASGELYVGNNGANFYNLQVAPSGGSTFLQKVSYSAIFVENLLTHNGGTFSSPDNMSINITDSGTISAGASIPYICYWGSTATVPTATFKYFIANTNTVTFAGDCTFTGYWRTNDKTIIAGAFSHSVRQLVMDSGGTFDLRNTTVTMTGIGSSTSFNDPNSTLITSNTNIIGHISGSNKTNWLSPAAAGHEIVGNVSNLDFQAGNDLTIIGTITNCTGEGFRQWHHTLDTQQLLDADSAGDDDLRLEKPALDNANELQTG